MPFNLSGHIVRNDDADIYRAFGFEVVTPRDLEAWAISERADRVIWINSGGGSLTAGEQMYQIIMDAKDIDVVVCGIAASAATFPLAAARKASTNLMGTVMIHNIQSEAAGDYRDMLKKANTLQELNKTLRNAYAAKTRLADAKLQEMMDAETWMTANEALEYGFVDEIILPQGQTMPDSLLAARAASIAAGGGQYAASFMRLPSLEELTAVRPPHVHTIPPHPQGSPAHTSNAPEESASAKALLHLWNQKIKINKGRTKHHEL